MSTNQKMVSDYLTRNRGQWKTVADIAVGTHLSTSQVASALRGEQLVTAIEIKRGPYQKAAIQYRVK